MGGLQKIWPYACVFLTQIMSKCIVRIIFDFSQLWNLLIKFNTLKIPNEIGIEMITVSNLLLGKMVYD
jgi:hypothetical protein